MHLARVLAFGVLMLASCSPRPLAGTKSSSKSFASSLFVQQEHFVPAPAAPLAIGASDPLPDTGYYTIGDPVDVPFGATEVLWTGTYWPSSATSHPRLRVCPSLGDGHNLGTLSSLCSYVGGPEDGHRLSWNTATFAATAPVGAAIMVGISFAEVGDHDHTGSVTDVYYSFR